MTETATTVTAADWKRRALQAEEAVNRALDMTPIRRSATRRANDTGAPVEAAEDMTKRYRQFVEALYPDLIVRHGHRRTEVFRYADACDCDPEGDDYDSDHCESADDGQDLCSRSFLGYVCDSCKDEEGDGPTWKPEAVAWPCPPVAALDRQPAPPAA